MISASGPARSMPRSCARRMRMPISSPSIPAARKAAAGVVAVLTGEDIKALTTSLVVGVKAPVECWPIAVGRVRYVGEPVAVVVATDRYLAEDAVDLIEVQYRAAACGGRSARGADARTRRCCMTASTAMSPATGLFAMAIRNRPLRRRRIGSVSISAIPAIPARRSRPMASSPTTTRAKTPTMCSPISRGRSASMRCCRAR